MFGHSPKTVNNESFEGISPAGLLKVAALGKLDIVSRYISENKSVKNALDIQNANGQTATHLAAEHGFLEILQALIEGGADVNVTDNLNATPLYVAVKQGKREVVRALLELVDIDLEVKSIAQYTALEIAMHGKDEEIIDMLIKHGAHIRSYQFLLQNAESQEAIRYLKKNKDYLTKLAEAQNRKDSSESDCDDSSVDANRRIYY